MLWRYTSYPMGFDSEFCLLRFQKTIDGRGFPRPSISLLRRYFFFAVFFAFLVGFFFIGPHFVLQTICFSLKKCRHKIMQGEWRKVKPELTRAIFDLPLTYWTTFSKCLFTSVHALSLERLQYTFDATIFWLMKINMSSYWRSYRGSTTQKL